MLPLKKKKRNYLRKLQIQIIPNKKSFKEKNIILNLRLHIKLHQFSPLLLKYRIAVSNLQRLKKDLKERVSLSASLEKHSCPLIKNSVHSFYISISNYTSLYKWQG